MAAFLADYYATSDAWSVKTAVHRVLAASNSWLHAETRRSQWAFERDKGWFAPGGKRMFLFADGHVEYLDSSALLPANDGLPHPNLTRGGIAGRDVP